MQLEPDDFILSAMYVADKSCLSHRFALIAGYHRGYHAGYRFGMMTVSSLEALQHHPRQFNPLTPTRITYAKKG